MPRLPLRTARNRYAAVKEGGRWLVDGVTEKASPQRTRLGKTLRYQESFELNGEPIDARLATTVLSFRKVSAPEFAQTKPGRRWYRVDARVTSRSSGDLHVNFDYFLAIDTSGRRYKGESGFEPGIQTTDLAAGDTIRGAAAIQVPSSATIKEVRFAPGFADSGSMSWTLR